MTSERLAARYRALATEEPSAVLDDAIRAAARRGVHAGPMRSRSSRWAVPVSIAAVLMLSVGVTMNMQREDPGIETSEVKRASPSADALEFARKQAIPELVPIQPAPQPAPAPAPVAKPPPKPVPAAPVVGTKPQAAPVQADKERFGASTAPAPSPPPAEGARLAEKTVTPAPAQMPPPPPASLAAQAPAPATASTAPPPAAFAQSAPRIAASPSPSSPPAPRAAGSAASGAMQDANVARREDSFAKEKRAKAEEAIAVETPERKLEKIVELRRAGKNAEADEAIARFRREHPEYKIPDATWERIKPQ
ncbi:hypothetical protein [Usitatibacter palustris]|uniref:Uncharacterized protein n=1 Tax=Usitatibacter palustris TaxID=2732487 RepID=A0A6M4H6Q5_9PROT|nr:hypothetical protein [Usitatibacter palustris]QJR14094.1 hypothetical protein DSM104440_00887 [Usitatibacter palustris]